MAVHIASWHVDVLNVYFLIHLYELFEWDRCALQLVVRIGHWLLLLELSFQEVGDTEPLLQDG